MPRADPTRSVRPRLPRFARTIAFKLALVQAALFAVSAAVLFAAVYVNLAGYARSQLRASIAAEFAPVAEERASDGLDEVVGTIAARVHTGGSEGFRYYLAGTDGRRLAGTLPPGVLGPGWQDVPASAVPPAGSRRSQPLEAYGEVLPTGEFLAVARDIGDVVHIKEQVVRSFGLASALTLSLAILGGVLTSLGTLRRVEAINAITRGIMEGDLGRRAPLRGTDDEFDRLAANTNAMLDRIQLLMEGLRQVSNDIAHDLRTPLTHLGQRLEAARNGPRTAEAYEAAIEAASGDVDTILRVFASLLRIAQVEAGTRRSGFADLDLSGLAASLAETFGPVAEDAGQTLAAAVAPGLRLHGDRDLLTQMLANLVENAIRHAGAGARITLSLRRDADRFAARGRRHGAGHPGGRARPRVRPLRPAGGVPPRRGARARPRHGQGRGGPPRLRAVADGRRPGPARDPARPAPAARAGIAAACRAAAARRGGAAPHRRPNRRSTSASLSSIQVGRPWLHWPEPGVRSISRRSAFISSGPSRRPALHRAVAGHGREVAVEPPLQRHRAAPVAALRPDDLGEVAHEPRRVAVAQRRGHLRHRHGAAPEGLDAEPERRPAPRPRRAAPPRRRAAARPRSGSASSAGRCRPRRGRASAARRRGARGPRAGRR